MTDISRRKLFGAAAATGLAAAVPAHAAHVEAPADLLKKDYPAGGYTYQYYTGAVEYPFGYGLSYTTFAYSNATVDRTSVDANGALAVSVDVRNTGRRAGSEIVQVYVAYPRGRGLPAKQIKGYAKVDLKAGETKTDVSVKFPKDNAPEAIKGKTCKYDLTVKSFRLRVLPDEKTFLENAKAESIDAVKKDIRERLEKQAVQADLDSRRNQAIELLLKKADFAVPNSQVRRQTQAYLQDLAQRAQYAGLSADYIEKNRDQILADAENNAVRQVRLGYILEGIVKAESIEATDDDVKQGLEKIAAAQREPTTADDVRKRLEENGNMEAYKDQLKAEKALDLVLAEAK